LETLKDGILVSAAKVKAPTSFKLTVSMEAQTIIDDHKKSIGKFEILLANKQESEAGATTSKMRLETQRRLMPIFCVRLKPAQRE
jgi:hypothetical protein